MFRTGSMGAASSWQGASVLLRASRYKISTSVSQVSPWFCSKFQHQRTVGGEKAMQYAYLRYIFFGDSLLQVWGVFAGVLDEHAAAGISCRLPQ